MADFVRVADVAEVPDPGKTLVDVDGDMVALFHVGGTFYAIDDVCTHDGGPLADGELRDHKIACPRHGAKFDIRSGAALSMPATTVWQAVTQLISACQPASTTAPSDTNFKVRHPEELAAVAKTGKRKRVLAALYLPISGAEVELPS